MTTADPNAIAIVGLSVDLPHARSLAGLDAFLRAGRCAIVEPSSQRLRDLGCTEPIGPTSLIDGYDLFDPEFFGISPGEALLLDPHQRRGLQLAVEAFQSAGMPLSSVRGANCSVYLSGYKGDWRTYFQDTSLAAHLGASHAALAGRLSWALDLRGPVTILDSGCCSSLLAVRQACQDLREGVVDFAVAGGITLYLSLRARIDGDVEIASEDGLCRSYDARARGTADGEGGAMVVLKRLDDARRAGHEILGILRGFGVTHSGRRSVGMAAPSPAAQVDAIRMAWGERDPRTVAAIEGHGSGTRLGDLVEARSLCQVFGDAGHPVYLSSVKSNYGHADHAAGILGLAKAVASLRFGTIYPAVNCAEPNDVIAASDVLRVPREPVPWPAELPRRIGVTSLGLTGTNVHVAIEAADTEIGATRTEPARVLLALSGRDADTVRGHAARIAETLAAGGERNADLAALSDTLMTGFDAESCRVAEVVTGRAGALRYLRRVADGSVPVTSGPTDAPAAGTLEGHGFALAQQIADAFRDGADLDWPAVRDAVGYPAEQRRCLVPPRPFRERRFWPDQAPRPSAGAVPVAAQAMPADLDDVFDATWREVLGAADADPDGDFFALGGNSVLALRLTALLAERAHRLVDLPTVYARPTAGELKQYLRSAGEYRAATTVSRDDQQHDRLSFGQEALWYIDRLNPGRVEYSVPMDSGLHGTLDVAAFRQAFADFTARHDTLRSRYVEVEGEPRLVIDPDPLELEVIDLLDEPGGAEGRHLLARKLVADRVAWPFDLAEGPLFRGTLIRWDQDEYVLALNSHHSIDDGWTPRILRRDLAELYAARLDNRPAKLPPLPMRYAEFATWQRRQLAGPRRAVLLDYWRPKLDGLEPLDLPSVRPRPAVQSGCGDHVDFVVPSAVTEGLRRVAANCACSLFAVTLAAYRMLLAELSGQRDVAIGIFTVGRNLPETQDMFGYFNNAVVLRETVSPEGSLRSAMHAEREVVRDALAHDDLPFALLVNELKVPRQLSRHPVFQAGMTFQNLPAGAPDDKVYPEVRRSRRWTSMNHGVVDGTAKWDLDLLLHETDGSDELPGELEFSTDLFDGSLVRRWADRYLEILDDLATTSDVDGRRVADVIRPTGPSRVSVVADTPAGQEDLGAPPAATEQIVRLWRTVLDGEVTPESNFFLSGGHSLLAIRMLVELQRRTGISVQLQDFMLEATVATLARRVDKDVDAPEPPAWSRLVDVNAPAARSAPLYLMHPSGGTFSAYIPLAGELGRPVKATQCRLSDLTHTTRWTDFVGEYTDAVVADSDGPYLLGGWSLGAYTAWTMAGELRRRGKEVAGVLVIDAPANHRLGEQPVDDSHVMLQRLLLRQRVIAPPARSFAQLHAFAVGIGLLDPATTVDQLDEFFAVARHNDQLLTQAILPRLDVPVTVFAARETVTDHGLPPDLGWSRVAARVTSAEVFEGGHFDLLNTHVAAVARTVGARMAEL